MCNIMQYYLGITVLCYTKFTVQHRAILPRIYRATPGNIFPDSPCNTMQHYPVVTCYSTISIIKYLKPVLSHFSHCLNIVFEIATNNI